MDGDVGQIIFDDDAAAVETRFNGIIMITVVEYGVVHHLCVR